MAPPDKLAAMAAAPVAAPVAAPAVQNDVDGQAAMITLQAAVQAAVHAAGGPVEAALEQVHAAVDAEFAPPPMGGPEEATRCSFPLCGRPSYVHTADSVASALQVRPIMTHSITLKNEMVTCAQAEVRTLWDPATV